MAIYGAFEPGTYEAWALNLFNNIFITPGIARGMSVIPTSPASMAVQVTLDGTAGDGVCYISNGCWLRIDTVQNLTISANGTGSTRTDAIVATVDPTGATATSLAVSANWSTGFTPGTNQFVVALISVPSGAVSIASGNITMNSATAKITGTSGGNSMTDADGVGLAVQDSSASSTLSVVLTGLTSGIGRNVVIQTTDTSAIGHQFTFDTTGAATIPGALTVGDVATLSGQVYLKPHSSQDATVIYTSDGTLGATSGYYSTGSGAAGGNPAGAYLWDVINNGFVFKAGTANGVIFPVSVSSQAFYGALGGGIRSYDNAGAQSTVLTTQQPNGSGRDFVFQTWDGTTTHNAFSVGTTGVHGGCAIDDSGNVVAPSFAGILAGDGQGFYVHDDGTNIILRFGTNPTSRNLSVQGWVNSGGYYSGVRTLVGSDGNFYTGVKRNGSSQNSKIFTGTNTPTGQGVGDIWINA